MINVDEKMEYMMGKKTKVIAETRVDAGKEFANKVVDRAMKKGKFWEADKAQE